VLRHLVTPLEHLTGTAGAFRRRLCRSGGGIRLAATPDSARSRFLRTCDSIPKPASQQDRFAIRLSAFSATTSPCRAIPETASVWQAGSLRNCCPNPTPAIAPFSLTGLIPMARITLRQLLDHAAEHGYGVPAFNINNMEQGLAIMEAAKACDAPVIMQASRGARSYAGDIMLSR
jgi:hypothetical protein